MSQGTVLATAPLLITPSDMELFESASHDNNPLHRSEAYARRTPFGAPLVYGVLMLLRACAHLPVSQHSVLRVRSEFQRPAVVGQLYDVTVNGGSNDNSYTVQVRDGSVLILRANVMYGAVRSSAPASGQAIIPRARAVFMSDETLGTQPRVEFPYMPNMRSLTALALQGDLHARGFDDATLSVLLGCSYVIGMELPGERALFTKLTVSFESADIEKQAGHQITASLSEFDSRFKQCVIDLKVTGCGLRANGTLVAFARTAAPPIDMEMLARAVRPEERVTGKSAVVIGASRGLGAALSVALAHRGFHVYALSSNATETTRCEGAGVITGLMTDATELASCQRALHLVAERTNGKVDALVLNAFPSVRPMVLEPEYLARIQEFMHKSFSIVSTPLAVFASAVAAAEGSCTLISSSYVTAPPDGWPHYVAAKSAAEGLVRAAQSSIPNVRFLIARPPQLMTDYSSAQLNDAMRVEPVATTIARRIAFGGEPGLELIEQFGDVESPC